MRWATREEQIQSAFKAMEAKRELTEAKSNAPEWWNTGLMPIVMGILTIVAFASGWYPSAAISLFFCVFGTYGQLLLYSRRRKRAGLPFLPAAIHQAGSWLSTTWSQLFI